MEINGKRFLVIGGAGFIGSHVVSELLKYDVKEVLIYDNFVRGKLPNISTQIKDPRCSVFEDGGDIRDVDILDKAMQGIDGVFHLAAMWLLHCKDYPRTAFDVNINGTFNVLEACAKNGIKRLVYSSSASVYGNAIEIPMTEEHPLNNRNFYGATKIAGEAMCRAFYDKYDLAYVGLRYMNVYGPFQDQTAAYTGVIPVLLNHIEKNETPEIYGDGTQAYDFISVRDAARANICAMKSNVNDENFNIGTGVQTSISSLCTLILKLTDSRLNVNFKPYSDVDSRRLVQNRIGSIKKSADLLDFEHSISLNDGLMELIQWRKEFKYFG